MRVAGYVRTGWERVEGPVMQFPTDLDGSAGKNVTMCKKRAKVSDARFVGTNWRDSHVVKRAAKTGGSVTPESFFFYKDSRKIEADHGGARFNL